MPECVRSGHRMGLAAAPQTLVPGRRSRPVWSPSCRSRAPAARPGCRRRTGSGRPARGADGIDSRFQQRRRLADQAGGCRAVELDAIAREDAGLTAERQVIAVLRGLRMRQQTGNRAAALDRPRRQRRLV